MELFLMSPPGPNWALRGRANFRSASAPQVDAKRALAEWLGLADAIEARKGRVIALVPPDDTTLTGLPYAAEAGHVIGRKLLLPSMAAAHRIGEKALWAEAGRALGLEPVEVATPPATWEAQGDVASFRGRTLLFFGGRTNRAGLEAARASFPPDALVLEIREPAFHGNMALLPLDAVDAMLVCRDVLSPASLVALDDAFGRDALVPVSEEEIRQYATNGLPIGNDLLAPDLEPERIERLVQGLGMNVVRLPMGELCGKAGGASRCLVSRATFADEPAIPPRLDFRVVRKDLVARCR